MKRYALYILHSFSFSINLSIVEYEVETTFVYILKSYRINLSIVEYEDYS